MKTRKTRFAIFLVLVIAFAVVGAGLAIALPGSGGGVGFVDECVDATDAAGGAEECCEEETSFTEEECEGNEGPLPDWGSDDFVTSASTLCTDFPYVVIRVEFTNNSLVPLDVLATDNGNVGAFVSLGNIAASGGSNVGEIFWTAQSTVAGTVDVTATDSEGTEVTVQASYDALDCVPAPETVDVQIGSSLVCESTGDEEVPAGMRLYHFVVVKADDATTPNLDVTFDLGSVNDVAPYKYTGTTFHFAVTVSDTWVLTDAWAQNVTPDGDKEPRLNLSHCTEGETTTTTTSTTSTTSTTLGTTTTTTDPGTTTTGPPLQGDSDNPVGNAGDQSGIILGLIAVMLAGAAGIVWGLTGRRQDEAIG